mmetsp:Transcript_42853/g.128636  ORF Transcript_42853/g.128636 Transcript_42853/m.128636 type:complete len:349 (-) Transcript_42853:1563-2609(-)
MTFTGGATRERGICRFLVALLSVAALSRVVAVSEAAVASEFPHRTCDTSNGKIRVNSFSQRMAEARSQAAQESARIRALVEALDDLDDLELSHLTLSNSHDHNGRRLMQNGGPPAYGGARLLQQANSPPSYGGRRSLLQASPAYPPRRSLIETPGAAPLHHTVEHVRSDGEVVAFQDVVLTDNELRFTLTSSSALPISAECTPDVQYVELRCAVSCEAPPLSAKLAWLDAASDLENDGADLGDAEVEIIRTEGAEQVIRITLDNVLWRDIHSHRLEVHLRMVPTSRGSLPGTSNNICKTLSELVNHFSGRNGGAPDGRTDRDAQVTAAMISSCGHCCPLVASTGFSSG